ncbi:MAG TPA: metallophosphoesterase [Bryobacteraceae bacterium]|nr:metallophosphoesterase [Bryobacteraceae bacterium]
MVRRSLIALALLPLVWSADVRGPVKSDSFRFAVLGDSGTGDRPAFEVGAELAKARATFPFDLVLLLGDNLYGGEKPRDFRNKFELPFKALLDAGVKFQASLGNHDDPSQRFYKLFNMNGRNYYTFRPREGIRFFALDSNYMDKKQLEWLENELKNSSSDWKICFFHHPLYSSGEKHGPSVEMRAMLEPLFVKYGVNLVLNGHEHFYERIKPQKDIYYFIIGSAAKLRANGIAQSEITAKGFAKDRAFTLMEIDGDQLYFQTLTRAGQMIDSGTLERRKTK